MASTSDLENQKHQGKSLEISDTKEIFLPSGGTITAIAVAATMNKKKKNYQKYGRNASFCDIAIVVLEATAELKNIRTNLNFHL